MRSVLFLLLIFALTAPAPAVAEEETTTWALVVDEGASRGTDDNAAPRRTALDLARAARARGHQVRFLAGGAKKDGKPVLAELRRTGKASDRSARLTAWSKEVEEASFHEEGRASALAALEGVLERHEEDGPLIVVFVGAFEPAAPVDGESDEEETDEEDGEEKPAPDPRAEPEAAGVQAWTEDAPAGSRLMALAGMSPKSFGALRELPRSVVDGFIILEAGAYEARTYPYSPLPALVGAGQQEQQSAGGELLLTTLALAPAKKQDAWAPLREVLEFEVPESDDNEAIEFLEPRQGRLTLSRSPLAGPRLELAFAWKETGKRPAIPLCDPPAPVSLEWLELRPDATLVQPEPGAPVRIVAPRITGTHEATVRILRTVSDPERRWWWQRDGGTPSTKLPDGLSLAEEEAPVDEDGPGRRLIRTITVRVRFEPQPGLITTQWKGKLIYKPRNSKVDELRVSVDVSTAPPQVRIEGEQAEFVLPRTSEAPGLRFRIASVGQPAPAHIAIEVSAKAITGGAPLVWRLRRKSGVSAPREGDRAQFQVPVGEQLELLLDLAAGSPPTNRMGDVRVTIPTQGDLQASGALSSTWRTRRPRLRLAELRPELRVDGDELVIAPPLRIELDPDGGDGAWLLARMRTAPVVRGQLGDQAPALWIVESEAPGVWRARPSGPWTGTTPGAFDDQEDTLHMEITWADGPAPQAFDLVVLVPARWGVRGWLFMGLAVMALALATFTFLQLRPPPIEGTLLYTAEGLKRTVGHLDLAPVGRKTMILRADKQGRLSVGSKAATSQGDALAVLRPTRVAGTIEIPGDDGTPEKRLLVDGLTVRIGAHALRYLSGQPTEQDLAKPLLDVPDLLGPEFDVGSGRFDAEVPRIGDGGGGGAPASDTPES